MCRYCDGIKDLPMLPLKSSVGRLSNVSAIVSSCRGDCGAGGSTETVVDDPVTSATVAVSCVRGDTVTEVTTVTLPLWACSLAYSGKCSNYIIPQKYSNSKYTISRHPHYD